MTPAHVSKRQHTNAEQNHAELRGSEDEYPAQQRHHRRDGIKPHAVRSRHIGRVLAQQHQADSLSHELHENARYDQRIDYSAQ